MSRVPGCWLCDDPSAQPPPSVPRDVITWYLVALHQLLGHDKAAAVVLDLGLPPEDRYRLYDQLGQPEAPVTTVRPSAKYL